MTVSVVGDPDRGGDLGLGHGVAPARALDLADPDARAGRGAPDLVALGLLVRVALAVGV